MTLTKEGRKKILWITVLCVVVCVAMAAITTRGCAMAEAAAQETYSGTFSLDGVRSIDIDFPAGDLVVRKGAQGTENVSVIEHANPQAARQSSLVCEQRGDTLSIRYQTDPLGWLPINWFGGARKLEVVIPDVADPEHELESLSLRLASGDAKVNGVNAERSTIAVVSGSATAEDLSSEFTNAELSSGSLRVKNASFGEVSIIVRSGKADLEGAVKKISADLASGELLMKCTNTDIESANLQVASGGITLGLPSDCGFDAAASKTSGNFNCKFDCSVRGEIYTYGDGSTPIDIRMASGNVTIEPNLNH